jgi:hypothetical protein
MTRLIFDTIYLLLELCFVFLVGLFKQIHFPRICNSYLEPYEFFLTGSVQIQFRYTPSVIVLNV